MWCVTTADFMELSAILQLVFTDKAYNDNERDEILTPKGAESKFPFHLFFLSISF